jgi:predicted NAD/FAD-binding protein
VDVRSLMTSHTVVSNRTRTADLGRRRVGIVGSGMAGVSLAWLLDGQRDVVVLEARDEVGGNIRSLEIDLDGHALVVDMGAQYFHPGPYPTYASLLEHLGLHSPDSAASATHAFPASITLTAGSEAFPRFVSPVVPERRWPFFTPWNAKGLAAFGLGFIAASLREEKNEPWTLTLEDWLSTLALKRSQREGMLLPWAASLFSGSLVQARGLSARAAMIFAAKALPPNPLDPIVYYALTPGMKEVLSRMLGQCSTVELLLGTEVEHLSRENDGGFELHRAGGPPIHVDDLVLAASAPSTIRLLQDLAGTERQRDALNGIEFQPARLVLHTDPPYAPDDPGHWSFFNADVQGLFCEASMWLASVVSGPQETTARLWKSWVTHRDLPQQVLHETEFVHMLPTVSTLLAQDAVAACQGLDGIWFAGGYLHPYDAQETALRSALSVAQGLQVTSERSQLLSTMISPESERAQISRPS